jgi:hypothetical protein
MRCRLATDLELDYDDAAELKLLLEALSVIGQLELYQWALDEQTPGRELFLAVSQAVYDDRIRPVQSAFNAIVERKRIKLIIFDEAREVILQWIQR